MLVWNKIHVISVTENVADTIFLQKSGNISDTGSIPKLSNLNLTNWHSVNSEKEYQISFYADATTLDYSFFEKDSQNYFAQSQIIGQAVSYSHYLLVSNNKRNSSEELGSFYDVRYLNHLGHLPNTNDNIFDDLKIGFEYQPPIIFQPTWQNFAHPIHAKPSVNLLYFNEQKQLCLVSDNQVPIIFEKDRFDQKSWKKIWDDQFQSRKNKVGEWIEVDLKKNNYVTEIDYYPYFISTHSPKHYHLKINDIGYSSDKYMLSPCHDYLILSSYYMPEEHRASIDTISNRSDIYKYRAKHLQLNVKCLPIERTSLEEFEKTGIPFRFVEDN